MALRNAFEGLATESTLRRLINSLNFARTSTDQLRTVVDSGVVALTSGGSNVGNLNQINWGANGSWTPWYANGAPNSMDVREQHKQAARAAFNQVRNDRWRFT